MKELKESTFLKTEQILNFPKNKTAHKRSTRWAFTNSPVNMLKLFLSKSKEF